MSGLLPTSFMHWQEKSVLFEERASVPARNTFVSRQRDRTKAQDGALIGHSAMCIKPGKLPVDRGVKEGFFHRQIRQGEPLLHAVNAPHGFQGKGWAAVLAFGVIRGNELNQSSPGNHPIHLGQ